LRERAEDSSKGERGEGSHVRSKMGEGRESEWTILPLK